MNGEKQKINFFVKEEPPDKAPLSIPTHSIPESKDRDREKEDFEDVYMESAEAISFSSIVGSY